MGVCLLGCLWGSSSGEDRENKLFARVYCGAATVAEDRSGMKCLRSRNGEARQLKCKGRVCREEGGRRGKNIFKIK